MPVPREVVLENFAKSSGRRVARSRLPLVAAAFVILVCGAIVLQSVLGVWAARTAALKNAEIDEANLARSLLQHAEDTFELADSLVLGLVNRLEMDGTGPESIAQLQSAIDFRKPTMGRIRGLFVYDDEGRWLASSEKVENMASLNNSDREYFKVHRAFPSRSLLIGNPIRSRSGGQWIVTATRRFNNPDGSFGGVVLASIDSSYFSQFYRQFDVGPSGSVSLLTIGGIVLARSLDNETTVGADISGSRFIKELNSRSPASTFYFKSPFDGLWRLGYYKASDKYPILIAVTEPKDEVLAEWRGDATVRITLVAGLTLLIAAIGTYLVRAMMQRQRMAMALMAKEADFRLLAEEASDMVMRIGLDENISYISPSCSRILGWDASQLTGTSALAGIHDEDLPRVRQLVAGLKQGAIEETKIIYRNRTREGQWIWLETTLHATRSVDTGNVDGVVAMSRDMTEHKDLVTKLADLAAQDGLTGLANRRQFDERLPQEWARAKRDGTALSLLMVDLDHFKQLNDQQGHQAGDACLQSIARVLAQEVRRPADLVARYGGEEFAVLLPQTDEAGAEAIGARIRQAVQDLALAHPLNSPYRCATVSIGGATGWPGSERSGDQASLVAAADRALYAAKNGGRNRVVMSGQVVAWRGAESA